MFRSLYFLDLFRRPIHLMLNSREFVSSNIGIIISLTIYALLLIQIVRSDIFYKEDPRIINQPTTQAQRPSLNYSGKIFTVSVVDDNSLAYIDPTIFSIKAKNVFMKSESQGGFYIDHVNDIKLHLCTEKDFLEDPEVYNRLGLKNSYCLDSNSFEMEGYWDEPTVTYFSIELSFCNNDTSPVVCRSSTDIREFFEMKYFNLVYSDLRVDAQNYTSPLTNKYRNDFQLIDFQMQKTMSVFIKSVTLVTDEGIVFSEESNRQSGLAYDSSFIDFQLRKNNKIDAENEIRFTCDFYSSKESYNIHRSYQKVSEIMSVLGGLLNFFVVLGFLLTYLESRYHLKKEIMNSLYYFQQEFPSPKKEQKKFLEYQLPHIQTPSNETNLKNSRHKSTEELENFDKDEENNAREVKSLNPKFPLSTICEVGNLKSGSEILISRGTLPESSNDFQMKKEGEGPTGSMALTKKMKEKVAKIKSFRNFQDSKSKIQTNFCQYVYTKILMFCRCCSQSLKQKLIIKAEEIYKTEMDISCILRKVHEIDKLKLILLNTKQLSLFNLLSKPMIYLDKFKMEPKEAGGFGGFTISEMISATLSEDSMKVALAYYETQQKNKSASEVDERLFKLLDENIDEFRAHFPGK